jgi:cytochrome c553
MKKIFLGLRLSVTHAPVGHHAAIGIALSLALSLSLSLGLSVAAMAQNTQKVVPDTIAERVVSCTACHGKQDRVADAIAIANHGYYPRLAGKPAGYLYNQLVNFREGRRQTPSMTYLVDHLSHAYLQEMADYFSALQPAPYMPHVPDVGVSKALLERGRMLVYFGDPGNDVPACIACHGKALTGLSPAIPGLLGLPPAYLRAQLGAWKNGTRHAAAPDCMAKIANRLSIDDVSAASAWLAAQPMPGHGAAALVNAVAKPGAKAKLPLSCGSFPQQGTP